MQRKYTKHFQLVTMVKSWIVNCLYCLYLKNDNIFMLCAIKNAFQIINETDFSEYRTEFMGADSSMA